MSRLASLATPTRRGSPSPSPSPGAFELGPTETTHHRMLKLVIGELRMVFRTWDELVGMDGLKAGQGIINEQTIMDNIVTVEEGAEREYVGPHLTTLAEQQIALNGVLAKLERLLGKISLLIDQAEKVYLEAHAKQSPDFLTEPLWYTWTIIHFVDSLPAILHAHVEHYALLSELAQTISSSKTEFDDAKLALERWMALSRAGERWETVREWEELVDLEMSGYGLEDGSSEEEEEVRPRRKAKGGKK